LHVNSWLTFNLQKTIDLREFPSIIVNLFCRSRELGKILKLGEKDVKTIFGVDFWLSLRHISLQWDYTNIFLFLVTPYSNKFRNSSVNIASAIMENCDTGYRDSNEDDPNSNILPHEYPPFP